MLGKSWSPYFSLAMKPPVLFQPRSYNRNDWSFNLNWHLLSMVAVFGSILFITFLWKLLESPLKMNSLTCLHNLILYSGFYLMSSVFMDIIKDLWWLLKILMYIHKNNYIILLVEELKTINVLSVALYKAGVQWITLLTFFCHGIPCVLKWQQVNTTNIY